MCASGSLPDETFKERMEPWNRSTVMLFGEEGGGKTSLYTNILGSSFVKRETVVEDTSKRWMSHVIRISNGISLSLVDFGGQVVLDIIHRLILTPYGVYVVVFRMDLLLNKKSKEKSLDKLFFWLHSIATRNAKSGIIPPVFLVGTHSDLIDPADHEMISMLITTRIQLKFPREVLKLIENDYLCFFPISNRFDDDVIVDLMTRVERVVTEADYVKAPRPLHWLNALDEMMATMKCFLTFEEACSVAIDSGLEKAAVKDFLSFLNEMGVVLWLDEEGLRNVIILDVMIFFVEPVSRVICINTVQLPESVINTKKLQEFCSTHHEIEWIQVKEKGIVGRQVMDAMLLYGTESILKLTKQEKTDLIVHLMVKYGIIIDLKHRANEMYLVPPLLYGLIKIENSTNVKLNAKDLFSYSCFFAFFVDPHFSSRRWVDKGVLLNYCYLPREFVMRLFVKAIILSFSSNCNLSIDDDLYIYGSRIRLYYENLWFQLEYVSELNLIRLDIEGKSPLRIYYRVHELIEKCLEEFTGQLYFMSLLPLETASESKDKSISDEKFVLLNLEDIRAAYLSTAHRINGKFLSRPLDHEYITKHFSAWLINTSTLQRYDVFISHRWYNSYDDSLSKRLFSKLGSAGAHVFYDEVRIKTGRIQEEFGQALINSTVFVPIISSASLEKMKKGKFDPDVEDNVLVEWMLALELMRLKNQSRIRLIRPIFLGSRDDNGKVRDLFGEKVIHTLPKEKPTASINVVKRLLNFNNINFSTSSLENRTVHSVVDEMSGYTGIRGWDKNWEDSSDKLIDHAVSDILDLVRNLGNYVLNIRYCVHVLLLLYS